MKTFVFGDIAGLRPADERLRAPGASAALAGVGTMLRRWRLRMRDRRLLAKMSDADLRDIGATRGDVEREETRKLFWRT